MMFKTCRDLCRLQSRIFAEDIGHYLATPSNNQEIKADNGKPQCRLVPCEIVRCIARVREYGLKKYGTAESWRQVEVERYQDAMYRHLLAYIEEPTGTDEESGLPHLWHIACNVAFLCEMQKEVWE